MKYSMIPLKPRLHTSVPLNISMFVETLLVSDVFNLSSLRLMKHYSLPPLPRIRSCTWPLQGPRRDLRRFVGKKRGIPRKTWLFRVKKGMESYPVLWGVSKNKPWRVVFFSLLSGRIFQPLVIFSGVIYPPSHLKVGHPKRKFIWTNH